MVHDELVMDKETGELITATEAIHIFYTVKKHKCLDSWLDDYELTGIDSETILEKPDFTSCLRSL